MQQRSRRRQEREDSPISLDESAVPQTTDTPSVDDDLVARRAFQRYEERGREDGHDQEDWFEAEREIKGGTSGGHTRGE